MFDQREDRPPYVRFERRPVEDKNASLAAGHVVCRDVDFALVTPSYSKDCVEHKVDTWLKNTELNLKNGRIPPKWAENWRAQYAAWKKGEELPLDGTSVKNWSAVTPAQVKNLIAAGCRTIEDLAHVNDEGLRRIGMGAMEMKNKAIAYIKSTKDHGSVVMENAALKNEIAQLKGSIEAMQMQIASLNGQAVKAAPEIEAIDLTDHLKRSDEDLRLEYKQKFGKLPHYKWSADKIREEMDKA